MFGTCEREQNCGLPATLLWLMCIEWLYMEALLEATSVQAFDRIIRRWPIEAQFKMWVTPNFRSRWRQRLVAPPRNNGASSWSSQRYMLFMFWMPVVSDFTSLSSSPLLFKITSKTSRLQDHSPWLSPIFLHLISKKYYPLTIPAPKFLKSSYCLKKRIYSIYS